MFSVISLLAGLNFIVPLYIQIVQGRTPPDAAIADGAAILRQDRAARGKFRRWHRDLSPLPLRRPARTDRSAASRSVAQPG